MLEWPKNLRIAGRYLFGKEKKEVGAPAVAKVLEMLNKEDLANFWRQIDGKSYSKAKKTEIIAGIVDKASKPVIREFLAQHQILLALHPNDLEAILPCSKSERL